MSLIETNSEEISIGDKVEIACGSVYGNWGGFIDAFSETGIEILSSFRGISETSMDEIINGINKYSPIKVIEHNREGKNSQLVIFIPWVLVEKIRRLN